MSAAVDAAEVRRREIEALRSDARTYARLAADELLNAIGTLNKDDVTTWVRIARGHAERAEKYLKDSARSKESAEELERAEIEGEQS